MIRFEDLIEIKGIYINSKNIKSLTPTRYGFKVDKEELFTSGRIEITLMDSSKYIVYTKLTHINKDLYFEWEEKFKSNNNCEKLSKYAIIERVLRENKKYINYLLVKDFLNQYDA